MHFVDRLLMLLLSIVTPFVIIIISIMNLSALGQENESLNAEPITPTSALNVPIGFTGIYPLNKSTTILYFHRKK